VPQLSVVIPIHNVEAYLEGCLESVAGQPVEDLEVIMVDDGSEDRSAAIAEEFAARDSRFRLIRQPNGGLGSTRNTGLDQATGEFLAFVDSDDVLAPNAYQLLLASLKKTGSDFATGNVHRLSRAGMTQAPFLAKVFAEPRAKTHISEFPALLVDRIVPNKLWRRSFWDAQGFRFPEGILHEDIPVVIPAQFAAHSVDVIAEPVYYYRIREEGALSITQRRLDPHALTSRVEAVKLASSYLRDHVGRKAKRTYDESVLAEDLRYFLNVLDRADDDYQALFLDRVNAFLDGVSPRATKKLPAIERLKWHLVRRRLMPELLEALRFQKEELNTTPPVRIGRRWYGDYPFRTDRSLRIPRSVYRLGLELGVNPWVERISWDGEALEIRGHAHIGGIGAPSPGSQKVKLSMLGPGRLRRVRLLTSAIRWRTSSEHRPDVAATSGQHWVDLEWSGFVARLSAPRLRRTAKRRKGPWELYITVGAQGIRRRRIRFRSDVVRPLHAVEAPISEDLTVIAAPTPQRGIELRVSTPPATISSHRMTGEAAELEGELGGAPRPDMKLRLTLAGRSKGPQYPVVVEGGTPARFSVAVPLADLEAQAAALDGAEMGPAGEQQVFGLQMAGSGRRDRVTMATGLEEGLWPCFGRELLLATNERGDAELSLRPPAALVRHARWHDDDVLELEGHLPTGSPPLELVLRGERSRELHAFPMRADADGPSFTSRLTPARVESLGGPLPLQADTWAIWTRPEGIPEAELRPVGLSRALYEELPLPRRVRHKPFSFGMLRDQRAALQIHRDLDDDERGRFNQRRLQETAYAGRRAEPLRDAVVYASFGGRQYSDSPRAIHEELVRRNAPLEHLWAVRDGMCNVPSSAEVLREGSKAYHEALAQARFVVTNHYFPDWFRRRPDQMCVQTWHGTPLKRLGLDEPELRRTRRRRSRQWDEQVANWQYFVSPNEFSTPILQRAYGIGGEILETGYPRDDVLAEPRRADVTREIRRRLDLPESARIVLYAPTFRDNVFDTGGYRLDLRLDIERLRDSLNDESVLLIRKHHAIEDAVPVTHDGFVRDASSYPDGTELLLAADVLITDYSSNMFDYANTGRPILFFTYDLAAYRDEIRGFYFDFAERAPGPLLTTTNEVAAALNDLDAVRDRYAARYAEFAATFCALDDGHAASRVVDRVFTW
jgi:CDP-glycerol glycerophosphotransferase